MAAAWLLLAWTASGQSGQAGTGQAPLGGTPEAAATAVVQQYCLGCHNDRTRTGGLSLQGRRLQPADAEVWEKVARKVSAGQMPPAGLPRPDAPALDRFVGTVEAALDGFADARPNPGVTVLHRLNRAEYANAVRDLLALDVDAAALLPADETSNGFDNVADALGLSPAVLERYLSAADRVSALAVGDAPSRPVAQTRVARADSHQLQHVEGLPLGTRGGLLIDETIPADGEYQISARLYRTNNGFTRGLQSPHDVEFLVDGARVFGTTVGGQDDWMTLLTTPGPGADRVDARLQARVRLQGGPRRIAVTFVAKPRAQNQAFFEPLVNTTDVVDSDGVPRIDSVTITGPLTVEGPGDTPSRRRIFSCRGDGNAQRERACAEQIARRLARLAYRRPVANAEIADLLEYYDRGRRGDGTFEAGVQMVIRRMLADPGFLFRAVEDPARVAAGAAFSISDIELASSLSFFLWSSIPDEELLRAAEAGRLRNRDVLLPQVRRMLADPKAGALVENFAGQWLQLRNLQRVSPDPMKYPNWDDNLRQAFRRETEMLFESLMREDRSILDLLRADYTFVNERLAEHYGMRGVVGSHFRRVPVANPARRGLLGHGSILTVTSHPNRTSPVKRGKWVLEQLLGAPPPPPPNVPPLDESTSRARPRTMKERMEEHRRNPTCANCHRLMDPVGLALENFDGVGGYRVREAGVRIDTTTELADGTPIGDVTDLRDAVLSRPRVLARTFTENMLVYALGRGLTADDMPAVRAVLRAAAANDYRFSSIVEGIATSQPFRMRLKGPSAD
ncbi:MAG: DUF1592 domain-containing protein [Vicinamibacterales bacterium]